jgi:phospholipid/cholesterol/gamma-HCH transport system permease protein
MPPTLSAAHDVRARATISVEPGPGGSLRLGLAGRLDARTTGKAWREATDAVSEARPRALVVDASRVDYADGSGIALLHALRRLQEEAGGTFELVGLSAKLAPLLELLAPPTERLATRGERLPPVAAVGRAVQNLFDEGVALVTFTGQVTAALAWAVAHPRRVRWDDVLLTAQRAGADAVGIVAIVGLLFGLVLSFQSAAALQRFGAQIFMADGLAIGLFREMGALLTAVILAGRSGSAFAAEIGTMKVNEEVDALTTMGIDPTTFLVVPRVVAGVAVMPILTLIFSLFA